MGATPTLIHLRGREPSGRRSAGPRSGPAVAVEWAIAPCSPSLAVCSAGFARHGASPPRLLGVVVSNLVEEEAPSQLSLFQVEVGGVEETARDRAVAQAIDHLRRRFGRDGIVRGRTTD